MKAKVRIRKAEDDKLYVVKTTKFISQQEVDEIRKKQETAKRHQKIRRRRQDEGSNREKD